MQIYYNFLLAAVVVYLLFIFKNKICYFYPLFLLFLLLYYMSTILISFISLFLCYTIKVKSRSLGLIWMCYAFGADLN